MEETKVFLNTWGAYNDGCIGYGWMTPDEAEEFIDNNPERDGGEWFIADIDNYLGVDFGDLNYCNVNKVIDNIRTLESLHEYEVNDIIAIMEYENCDVEQAIDSKDDYIIYENEASYINSMDDLLDFRNDSVLARWFDYEAYHEDCIDEVFVASNGRIIV